MTRMLLAAESLSLDTISGNDVSEDDVLSATVSSGDLTSYETVIIDTEPLKTELEGVNEKLSLLLAVVICFLVWKCCTVMYKFFDMFF